MKILKLEIATNEESIVSFVNRHHILQENIQNIIYNQEFKAFVLFYWDDVEVNEKSIEEKEEELRKIKDELL